jgi:glucokinase
MNPSLKPLAVGIDLGGTQLRAALVDQLGNILKRAEVATKAMEGPEIVVRQIGEIAASVTDGVADDAILGVGVSSPGPLDTDKGTALSIPTLVGFVNYPLRTELQKRFAQPVHLENDGISAAIGEWKFGAGQGLANVVYVTVSTGVGGGVIVDNKVLRGRMGMAGHVGHMVIAKDGERCNCGNRGCFEAYCAGPFFAERGRRRAEAHAGTSLGKNSAVVDARAIFAAARAGDQLAQELVAEQAAILGTGFASLAHLFSPDVIIMGGGLSNEFELLRPGVVARFREGAMPAFKDVTIMRARLGANSGLIGAASLVFDRMDWV